MKQGRKSGKSRRVMPDRLCVQCGASFAPASHNQTWCAECRRRDGRPVLSEFDPMNIETFYESEAERRVRRLARLAVGRD